VASEVTPLPEFPGFPDFRANVTFVPIQFFTIVLPNCSRGVVRVVGYALRKLLGWVDEHGNPTREQLQFTYRELIEQAGISRGAIGETLKEAVDGHLLRCVESPSPHLAGETAQSGVYELCWDAAGRYTDDPAQFRGFYYPEAALVEEREGGEVVPRPKAARKNIPNAFFDVLLSREPLSVIRVVGALLFYSIQWGAGGERKVPVTRSITELSRLTRLSRQHVHEAVLEARQRGYIEQVEAGCFDPAAGQGSEPATYGIRWVIGVATTVPESERFKKVYGASVQKGVREQFNKVNGERFKKVNGIRIKTELKTETTTAAPGPAAPGTAMAAAESALELLKQTGFDEPTARQLAGKCFLEVIQRQVQWLPLRNITRNRLGLLRRAIEQDWPKPEGAPQDDGQRLGHVFASHYYAAYHGYTGEAATEPFPKDAQAAARFVERLLAREGNESVVPEWGRQFGCLMRQKHHGDVKARPNLSFAIVLHGDEFLRTVERGRSARARNALEKSHAARHAALRIEYLTYLRLAERDAQQTAPGFYAAFAQERDRTRRAMTGGLFQAAPETLAKFDSEESRLLAFAEFFRHHPQRPVLDFAQWDNQQNLLEKEAAPAAGERDPVRFSSPAATETSEPAAGVGVCARSTAA